MQADLHDCLTRFAGVIALTLVPVVFITSVSMPLSLNRHAGEGAVESTVPVPHMT